MSIGQAKLLSPNLDYEIQTLHNGDMAADILAITGGYVIAVTAPRKLQVFEKNEVLSFTHVSKAQEPFGVILWHSIWTRSAGQESRIPFER